MFQRHSNHEIKRARSERERGDGVPLCNAVSWRGKSCAALGKLPLSRLSWAHGTQDLSVLYCPGNAVAPVPCQAPFGPGAECSSSPKSPVRINTVSTNLPTHEITLFSLTSHFLGERWLRAVHWQVPSSEAKPCAKPLTNTNCPSKIMLQPGHLTVSLISDPVCLVQCHRSHLPPSWDSLWDQI